MCVGVRQSVASVVSSTRHPPLAWLCTHSPRHASLPPPLRSAATYSQCANICIFKLVVVVEVVVALLVIALLVVVVVVVLIVAVVVHCCSALLKQPQNS